MKKKNNYPLLVIVFIGLILFLILGYYIGNSNQKNSISLLNTEKIESNKISLIVPAIDNNNRGVAGILTTEIRGGSGLVLVNVDNVLAGIDTQNSARTAVKSAQHYTNINLNNIDVIYDLKVNASFVEGTSAGGAMAVSLIALLEDKSLTKNMSITGSINEDGTIGAAAGIEQKSEALKQQGINLLLISDKVILEEEISRQRSCIKIGKLQYCQITYSPLGNLSPDINIKRVKNLNEAMIYFYEE